VRPEESAGSIGRSCSSGLRARRRWRMVGMCNEGPLEVEELTAPGRTRLLADLTLLLARNLVDLESTLRAAIRGAGEPLADAGAVWLLAPGREHLEP
jgi:hypothetical protein